MEHQFIDRDTGRVVTERLFADRIVTALYHRHRESTPRLFRALTSRRVSHLLGFLHYDLHLPASLKRHHRFLHDLGVDLNECVAPLAALRTPRQIFERQIRYWECRPMPEEADVVVSPADARVLLGSLAEENRFFVKEKFFHFSELFGDQRRQWLDTFADGDYALFRLTPEKYHYTHTPVAGRVEDHFLVGGDCHACNPSATVALATPFSKNRRTVTVIDTDCPGGTGVGHVAMIEVVALMIGDIRQCYSSHAYQFPRGLLPDMFVTRGQPKAIFRPGSSTVILLFERDRVRFAPDLIANMHRVDAASRFSRGFRRTMVETDIRVRSPLACRREPPPTTHP